MGGRLSPRACTERQLAAGRVRVEGANGQRKKPMPPPVPTVLNGKKNPAKSGQFPKMGVRRALRARRTPIFGGLPDFYIFWVFSLRYFPKVLSFWFHTILYVGCKGQHHILCSSRGLFVCVFVACSLPTVSEGAPSSGRFARVGKIWDWQYFL